MIVCRTPLRVSFLGGGSDLPVHYRRFGGAVLSASIRKYVYVTVNRRFDNSIRVSYSKTEEVAHARHVEHRLVRAALLKLGIDSGIEITSIADIPSRGTGLGSSSAFTTSLLHALHAYQGRYRSQADLAAEACDVEINLCNEPIGKQDQYAAAVGGVNILRFNPDESVTVEPVVFSPNFISEFQDSMLLFYTGVTRSASDLLRTQIEVMGSDDAKSDTVRRMADMTTELRHAIQDNNLAWVGDLLHQSWLLKQSVTSGITNPVVDEMYAAARSAGAYGGKLLGAGGGGFLLTCAPRQRHDALRRALSAYRCLPFHLDWTGTSIIHYTPQDPEPDWHAPQEQA